MCRLQNDVSSNASASGLARAAWIAVLCAVAVLVSGCMTVEIQQVTMTGNSQLHVTAPKTVTTTTDTRATIPATALGL